MSERQTQVSNEQTKAALKQAGISHQSLLNERFQNGAEMLGSNTISVRLGGIYALNPNPPKDTDGRREDSGRGWVRELQGRWPGVLG